MCIKDNSVLFQNTFFTHRQPVIHHTMAMVAAISPGHMQPHHHLVPVSIFAQMLWQACQIAFGQPLELLHHLLSLVHLVETMDPKHGLDLHLQGSTLPNGLFWGSTNPRQSMMTAPSMNVASPHCSTLFICSLDQSPTRARTFFHRRKKCTHGGYPVESPLVFNLPT